MKHTYVDTGLPGKEKTGLLLNIPNKSGFPGFILIFQNFSLKSSSIRQLLTKSFFPTETPPVVIIISDLEPCFNIFFIIFIISGYGFIVTF